MIKKTFLANSYNDWQSLKFIHSHARWKSSEKIMRRGRKRSAVKKTMAHNPMAMVH
jgi:hypothetical protein